MSRIGLFLPRSLREILVQAFWSLLYRLLALLGLERLLAGLRQRLGLFLLAGDGLACLLLLFVAVATVARGGILRRAAAVVFGRLLRLHAHAARLGAIGADVLLPVQPVDLLLVERHQAVIKNIPAIAEIIMIFMCDIQIIHNVVQIVCARIEEARRVVEHLCRAGFAEVAVGKAVAVRVLSPVGAIITIFVNPSVNVLANIGMHWGRRDGKRCRRGACERQDGAWNAHVVCDGRVGPAPGKTEEGGW